MPGSGENSDLGCPWGPPEDKQGRKPAKLKGAAEKGKSHSQNCNPGQQRSRDFCDEEGESNKPQKRWKEPCWEGTA